MNTIRKYIAFELLFIVVLFAISVFVRKENIEAPLARDHEWITAHTLITTEIWSENNGPSTYSFTPVYTKNGIGNSQCPNLGGITDEKSLNYYVSYPPFAFIFYYYSSFLFGGPSVSSIRIISLLIHLITAVFISLLIRELSCKEGQSRLNIAGIISAGCYLFAEGNLWFHANLYFVDLLVAPLLVACLWLSIKYYKGNYTSTTKLLFFIGLCFFLATYTEWMGLFFALLIGVFFLIATFLRNKKTFFKAFFVIAFSSSFALGLTVVQYTSIAGWEKLQTASQKKYDERSGHGTVQGSSVDYNIHSSETFDDLITTFLNNYETILHGLIVSLALFILLAFSKNVRKYFSPLKLAFSIIFLFILALLAHYLLFFNFNSVHEFSGVKTGLLITLIIGILIQQAVLASQQYHKKLGLILSITLLLFFTFKAYQGVHRYKKQRKLSYIDQERLETAAFIAQNSGPKESVFTNIDFSPELAYYAQHSIFSVSDTSIMSSILSYRKSDVGHYYYHEKGVLQFRVTLQMKQNKLSLSDTLFVQNRAFSN